jgi:hypothetical protein
LFSHFEKKFIKRHESLNDKFFDELRQVRYTVLGAVRLIKKDIIKLNNNIIDENILIGINSFELDQDAILEAILSYLRPFVNNAINDGANIIRVIIPCNTLSSICSKLENILNNDDGSQDILSKLNYSTLVNENFNTNLKIEVPNITDIVINEMQKKNIQNCQIIASKAAYNYYMEEIINKNSKIRFKLWEDGQRNSFKNVLIQNLDGKKTEIKVTQNSKTNPILSACTDIKINGTIDSLEIFAKELVKSAYSRIYFDPTHCLK